MTETVTTPSTKPLIVFDVNETLLDLETMKPTFARIFRDDPAAMRLWFANLILYSEALTLSNTYVPFTDIGGAVMQMLADARGIAISAADKQELTRTFAAMPPHPDVPGALQKLREAGFRLFTLTDNLLEVQGHQLEAGGIIHNFERRFSVDQAVKRHKPAPEAYAYVEQQLGTKPSDMLLIAAHIWDTMGAQGAGWSAAFIARRDNATLAVGHQPNFVGKDLADVADQLIARYSAVTA
ncbi:MAG TPA: haloacid dehalogenase type II [Candidatus Sulfotelmatobacter sp.]|nr:haloacid dehalogenase type II [Candidatus Sulfotelmatobacter sp.]